VTYVIGVCRQLRFRGCAVWNLTLESCIGRRAVVVAGPVELIGVLDHRDQVDGIGRSTVAQNNNRIQTAVYMVPAQRRPRPKFRSSLDNGYL